MDRGWGWKKVEKFSPSFITYESLFLALQWNGKIGGL